MPTLPLYKCQWCSKEYKPPREVSRFCSRSCQVSGKNVDSKHLPVKLICEICKKEFEVPYSFRKQKTCSKSCASTLANQNVDKIAFAAAISKTRRENIASGKVVQVGHKHSEETKKHLSEVAKLRFSIPENNFFLGKKRSEESKQKQSKTRSERYVDGTYDFKTWTEGGHVFSSKLSKEVFCRSSWEKKAVQILDEDINVVTFKIEPFAIEYLKEEGDRLNLRHYIPDFLVEYTDGRKVIIEVKPECHVDAAINVAKFAAAHDYCSKNNLEFCVWTQNELGIQK